MGQYRMIHFVRRHLALRPDIEVSIVLLDIIMSIKMLFESIFVALLQHVFYMRHNEFVTNF